MGRYYDPILTDYVNNADHCRDDVYYQGNKLHKIKKKFSTVKTRMASQEKHCQLCFLNG